MSHPLLKAPLMLFDFATLITENMLEAWRFYHEMSLEILELIR